jgi:hypothetical protein
MLFGIWLVFKRLRLISGNAMLFHDKTANLIVGIFEGLKDIGPAGSWPMALIRE